MPLSRRLTNWLSASLASRIGGVAVVDPKTGFRAISRRSRIGTAFPDRYYRDAFLLAAWRAGTGCKPRPLQTIYQGARKPLPPLARHVAAGARLRPLRAAHFVRGHDEHLLSNDDGILRAPVWRLLADVCDGRC